MDGLTLLLLIAVTVSFPLWAGVTARFVMRRIERAHTHWERRRARNQPAGPPIERLSSDLRRLLAELDRIETSNPPAKVARLRATSLAYDDVLLAACRALDVDLQAAPPLQPFERLEAEAELVRHGLRW